MVLTSACSWPIFLQPTTDKFAHTFVHCSWYVRDRSGGIFGRTAWKIDKETITYSVFVAIQIKIIFDQFW